MANNTGNFLSGFGEGLLKTLQSEREKRQQEQQFNQKMAFETRQMNLLNAYRQKQLEMQGSQPFETKTGEVYPSQGGVPNFEKPLWTPPEAPMKPQTFDIEGSYKNPETGTYWTFDKNEGKPRDLGIPYDKSEGRSITNNNSNSESTTPYINFDSVDEMVRNYNKRTEDGVQEGSSYIPVDEWRSKVNEKVEKNLRDAGISQEVSDKIWELAGIQDGDTAIKKRKKLKNVLDQQSQLPDYQRRALYQMVEVRTR